MYFCEQMRLSWPKCRELQLSRQGEKDPGFLGIEGWIAVISGITPQSMAKWRDTAAHTPVLWVPDEGAFAIAQPDFVQVNASKEGKVTGEILVQKVTFWDHVWLLMHFAQQVRWMKENVQNAGPGRSPLVHCNCSSYSGFRIGIPSVSWSRRQQLPTAQLHERPLPFHWENTLDTAGVFSLEQFSARPWIFTVNCGISDENYSGSNGEHSGHFHSTQRTCRHQAGLLT